MFTENDNLDITFTKLDSVLFEQFNARKMFPFRATAQDSRIFKVIDTTHSQYVEEVAKDVGLYQLTEELNPVATSTPAVKNEFITPINTYTNSIRPSKQLFDDNMHNVWQGMVKSMADKFFVSQDINAFGLYRNATTTTLCANGSPLITTSYPLIGGGTDYNLIPGPLSETTLEAAIVRMAEQKDEAGTVLGNYPVVLLVPQARLDDAVRITKSTLTPSSANNAVNVYLSVYGFEVMATPYLGSIIPGGSDQDCFLLSDSHVVTRYLRQGLETALTPWQFSQNLTYFYQANFREGYGAASQVGIVGIIVT